MRAKLAVFHLAATIGVLATLAIAGPARADGISFAVSNNSLTSTSGGTVTFDGTLTNNSGGDLNASDFFFNFFGFDPTAVTPNQDLGVLVDFLIPNGTTSTLVALFDVTLGSVPDGSTFPIEVQLEDINLDLSDSETVTVSTGGSSTVPIPEPSTLILLAGALATLVAARRTVLHNRC
jgi:hypothetical protein